MLMVWSTAIEIHPSTVILIKQLKNHGFLHETGNFPIHNHPCFQQNFRMSTIAVHKRCQYYYMAETLKKNTGNRMFRILIKRGQLLKTQRSRTKTEKLNQKKWLKPQNLVA